jgi:predicted nucleotidyltransferase
VKDRADLERLPRHRILLERAVALLRSDARISGLIPGGSLARGGMDSYSDLDLYIVVRDEHFDFVFGERAALAGAVGDPLLCFTADAVPGGSLDYIVPTRGRSSSISCTIGPRT